MAQWKVKELSKLTNVTVRMLHHYDKIGLLKPVVRTSAGYRLYNEDNLATLQQIIALKFFGFSLSTIKTMLQKKASILDHLQMQKQVIKEQTQQLEQAHDLIDNIVERYSGVDSLKWNDLVALIKRYNMATQVKKDWERNFSSLKQTYPKEVRNYELMVEKANAGKMGDPKGPEGKVAVKAYLAFTKAQLSWEKSAKIALRREQERKNTTNEEILKRFEIAREMQTSIALNQDGLKWFSQAITAYYDDQWNKLYTAIKKADAEKPEGEIGKKLAQQWRDLIDQQTVGMHSETSLGLRLWQEIKDTQSTISDQPSPKDKKTFAPIYLDPKALAWINTALENN